MENYKIYVHIVPDGKLYIGQTRLPLESRYGKNGNYYKGCIRFYEAIQKYGWDNITHILLFDNLTSDMADIIEIELIKKYNTTNVNYGYNMTSGGKDTVYAKKCYQYDLEGNYIREYKTVSEAVEKYGVSIYQNLVGNIHSAYGFLWSYNKKRTIEKYKNKLNGLPSKNKIVYQYDFDGNFLMAYDSSVQASHCTKIPPYRISSCANGTSKSAGGFMWSYEKKKQIYPYKKYKSKGISKNRNYRTISVYQYDLYGNFIKRFNTIKDAINELGLKNGSSITSCCRGRQKSAYGYIWSYELKNIKELYDSPTSEKTIIQLDKNKNIINTFDSIAKAEMQTNVPHSNIIKCCKGDRKTAGGYIWSYAI